MDDGDDPMIFGLASRPCSASIASVRPQVAQSAIDADPEVARAIIVTGTGSSPAPRLFGIAAMSDGTVAVEDTAGEAIAALTGS